MNRIGDEYACADLDERRRRDRIYRQKDDRREYLPFIVLLTSIDSVAGARLIVFVPAKSMLLIVSVSMLAIAMPVLGHSMTECGCGAR